MLSTIIISPSIEKRHKRIDELLSKNGLTLDHPDLLLFNDEDKLGVEAVKKIKEFLSLKPYSAKVRGVVIISAHKLTLDAQNSLLKILEEPPEDSIILLGAVSDKNFLPTILSRCQIWNLEYGIQNTGSEKYYPEIENLMNSSLDERFTFVEKLEDKEGFIKALVSYFSHHLPENYQHLEFSKRLIDAEKYLSAKGNQRAILEYLMLTLPDLQKF